MGQRPYRRASLVFKPVSSINTNWRTSQPGCCRRQSFRAALTSGRSCSAARVVFFIAQTQLLQPVPQGGDADGDLQLLPAPPLQFAQRQIRLRRQPAAQGSIMLFQPGAPVTANLFGLAGSGEAGLLPKKFAAFSAYAQKLSDVTL